MRRIFACIISLFFTFLIFKGESYAEDNTVYVEYDARTNEFSLDQNQDLFVDLKQVVPGDNITQKIDLNVVDLKNGETVKIYLQAENPNSDYDTLTGLSGVKLTVNNNGENIQEKIDTPLLIGYFPEDNEVNIDVNLIVDKTVGNEIANLDADIDWIFSAEIIENTEGPKTGDDTNVGVIIMTFIISLGFIFLIMWFRKIKTTK